MQNKGFPQGLGSLAEAPWRGKAGGAGALVLLPLQPLPPSQGINIGTTLMAAPGFVPTERFPPCLFLLLISGEVQLVLLPSPGAPWPSCARAALQARHTRAWAVPASPQGPPGCPGWCWDTGQSLLGIGGSLVLTEKEQQGRAL